jgi:hypothetical protein
LTAARLYLDSPPEAPKNWVQINPNLNDYHSDSMEISRTFWIPDITDWWRQQEETHSKYADLYNVARDIFSIIPHGVRVEASVTLGRDVIGWRQSKTTGETLCEKVIVRQFAWANHGILAGTDPELDTMNTDNDSEMKKEHQQKTFLSGRNGSVRVDALCQSRQRHPGGGLLRARRQYHASRCIPPSDRRFFSLCRSPILNKQSGVVANCDHTWELVHWVHACIEIAMQLVTLRKSLLTFLLHYTREA